MVEPHAYDLREITLRLTDGTSTPITLDIKFDEGNLTYSSKRNMEYRKDRGILDSVREGEDEPMDISFEGRFNALISSSGDSITIDEFLRGVGAASAHETTGNACDAFAVDLHLRVNHTCSGVEDELITFLEFRFEDIGGDFKAGVISVTGKCNKVAPTSIRTTFT